MDGRSFAARDAVIGAIHPHLLGQMIDGMDPKVRADAEATHITPAACITVHAALDAPLQFRTADRVDAVMVELLPPNYETLRRAFDELRYGQLLPCPLLGLGSLSQFDPSRVPPGKAILHLWDYVPYQRPDGRSWDEAKQEYADRMLAHMSKFVANISAASCSSGTSTARSTWSAPRRASAAATCMASRPRPTSPARTARRRSWASTRCPGVERLYLVGPFQHPGGGVFGAGRATAMKMFEDLRPGLRAPGPREMNDRGSRRQV